MKHFALAALIAATPITAIADPESDATYIVGQTLTQPIFEGALSALRPVILSATENDLAKTGITVSDIGGYMDIVMAEFMNGYIEIMKAETIPFYLETFTANELRDIAEFYATPSGQSLLARTPAMMQHGAKTGSVAGQQAFLESRSRVRQRLIDENIDVTAGDKSMMRKLLDALK